MRVPLACCLTASILLAACDKPAQPTAQVANGAPKAPAEAAADDAADRAFDALAKSWIDRSMALSPATATQAGDHRFDHRIDDLSAAGQRAALDFAREILQQLGAIDRSRLSRGYQVDYAILDNHLRYQIWTAESANPLLNDPTAYTQIAGSEIYTLMVRDFAPLPERLKSATARLEQLPAIFAQMRANLDPAKVPRINAETAVQQLPGVVSLVDELVLPNAGQLDPDTRQRLDAAVGKLRASVEETRRWLADELVPHARGDFRIGAEAFDRKLAFALDSPLSRAEIRRRAEAEMRRVRSDMYALAKTVLAAREAAPPTPATPSHDQQQAAIEAALALAYADVPARDQVVATAEESLARATAFVRDRKLVSLPDAPVRVVLMPQFQRGVAVAYCDPPGPLDRGMDTFFAVSPIPEDWDAEQVSSFLREYNRRSIEDLTIHEAMPGHYLQLAHANGYPSTLRALLYSGPFVEGWAVYAEDLMAEQGYLDGDPLFRLVQLKWYLRTVANAILDQAIHVDGMSREEAMRLMTVEAFQQEREAAGKWVRAQLTSTQLSTYFVGVQEHLDLRRAVQARDGGRFDLRRYHDQVLSYGSPPVRFVRELMLGEPIH